MDFSKQPGIVRVAFSIIRITDSFTEVTGRVLSWLNIALVISICTVVFMRYVLSLGSIALQELAIYLHAFIFLGCCAYTLRHDGHVRVDIFYRRFSARKKAIVNVLGTLFLLTPVSLFIGYASWDYIETAWQLRESSHDAGGLPWVYLLKSMILFLVATLLIQAIAELLRGLLTISGYPAAIERSAEPLQEAA
ncbi:TRAP transporter small permease subunit [Parendozoicomonas haliclonae]|uniref:TRAP transporter small permease protein n=1 Tax=Parendozoicomonas haliclonae TaxID=1960125 RepID=A0A1X7ALG6_9GAMM|nr:TRAP transporter small permease subunit [Parendozoicomonas haliclonae]SMA45895.1 Tripartite ATP-independent periplasmic transporter, DctQ component [Parendozoicomonas haliclonae]